MWSKVKSLIDPLNDQIESGQIDQCLICKDHMWSAYCPSSDVHREALWSPQYNMSIQLHLGVFMKLYDGSSFRIDVITIML
jgi:hypothetical protein